MSKESAKEWVLPALIPFEVLKGKDLEACIYWLFDAMGAKELEWRTGGSGGGAADGGRDLEAIFYTPGADNEIESQRWWIECKGRKGTVDAAEVKYTIINAQGSGNLDYLVIATNTQFSNPTRDWVKDWQAEHALPKIKLWDHAHLERLLSRHPDVVLRLHSEALSAEGRLQALESRFWNRMEFVPPTTLANLWEVREQIDFTAMGLVAVVVNEFVNGNIMRRPWGASIGVSGLMEALRIGLLNASYLFLRCYKRGIDQEPIQRTLAYLILCALDGLSAENVTQLINDSIYRGHGDTIPNDVKEMLLIPIACQLLYEMRDVCSSDCKRVTATCRRVLANDDKDEIDNYWLRFDPSGRDPPGEESALTQTSFLVIETYDEPCVVGFSVDRDNKCPLFCIKPAVENVAELLVIIKRVAAFRKAQSIGKRAEEKI